MLSRIGEIPPQFHTEEYLSYHIRYEEMEGVHTYHYCDCGRGACRAIMCVECWKECLISLKENKNAALEL